MVHKSTQKRLVYKINHNIRGNPKIKLHISTKRFISLTTNCIAKPNANYHDLINICIYNAKSSKKSVFPDVFLNHIILVSVPVGFHNLNYIFITNFV